MSFKFTIIFPPQWTPLSPHFAISSLAGYLIKEGYKVKIRDLNIEFFNYILTNEYVKSSIQKALLTCQSSGIELILRLSVNDSLKEYQTSSNKFLHIVNYLQENKDSIEKTIELLPQSIETMQCPDKFYNPYFLIEAMSNIDQILEYVSLPYWPSSLQFNDFNNPWCLYNIDDIINYCNDKNNNIFYEFYQNILPNIIKDNSGIIAFSINSFSQFLPGLTLAMMLKKEVDCEAHITIGGNFFGRLKNVLLQKPIFFKSFADSVIIGEGEKPLSKLAKVLEKSGSLKDVASTIFLSEDGENVFFSYEDEPERLDNVGVQSLDGLPLDKYLSPEFVLPIRASKGCYWGKCTFCDSDFGVTHDIRSIDNLVEEIRYLKDTYGIRNFEFIDECLPPNYMKRMAQSFIKANLNIHWFSNARTEEEFIDSKLLLLLRNSGLTMLLWGIESGNKRLMDLINKGVVFEKRQDILKQAAQTGIWNFAYIFFGFPSETKKEAMDTINFICDNTNIIHSYGRSIFTLGRHTQLHKIGKKYGIIDIIEDPQELSTNLYYRTTRGMDNNQIMEIFKKCTQLCFQAYKNPLWMYLRYREILHLYLAHYGYRFIREFKFTNKTSLVLESAW